MTNKFLKLLKNKSKHIFFDGAMGSMLQKRGLAVGDLPENLNISNSQIIKEIHKEYILSGSNVITTNTFGAYNFKFNNLDEIIKSAISNAKFAIKSTEKNDVCIALDLGPTGKLIKPLGNCDFDDVYNAFKESAILGEKYGADLAIIETISDTYEAKAAILAVKENTNLPIICTMTLDSSKRILTGGNILSIISLLESLNVDAFGLNCGLGPNQLLELLDELYEHSSIPIIIQPNAGLPTLVNETTIYDLTPDEFAKSMNKISEKGAFILGGCCGTTPLHIEKMISLCNNHTPKPIINRNITFVSSYGESLIIGNKPVIVGERINPTGKKKLKEALYTKDMTYIINEAIKQEEQGANILDVNVGLPDIDEVEMITSAIMSIQKVTKLPLQIDTSSHDTMEKALRVYNGKPLINSVNGKKSSMDKIFPIAKKYGGVIVALTLDENGIPPTAIERYNIAKKIIDTAKIYGIDKKNIIIDCLTLTVSAQPKESRETLKAIKLVKEKLGVKTTLGVSNISFGLPNRSLINSTFFAMALEYGLDACIINPLSTEMMDVFHAFNVLSCNDINSEFFISKYGDNQKEISSNLKNPIYESKTLKDSIIDGLSKTAYTQTKKLLLDYKPLDIVNDYLVPALDIVGGYFESGRMFLPQLIQSGDAANSSFSAIKEFLDENGIVQENKGTIILATVEGDIHDIGKNIVKSLLINYGYSIIDLGNDVTSQKIVDSVNENHVKLVGLSALMTTTVLNMKKIIAILQKECPDTIIMVGGAVLNEEFAKTIKANFYGKDALAAVDIAKKVFL